MTAQAPHHTHLTSPACVLSFPRTSSSTPGVLFTLQNGTRTAACGSVRSGAMPSWLTAARASLMSASEARVNGVVSEMMEEDGVILVAVMNVLDNILPFCSRASECCCKLCRTGCERRQEMNRVRARFGKPTLYCVFCKWTRSKRPTRNGRRDGTFVYSPPCPSLTVLQDQRPEDR